jgi:putative FmdB family regulatory protein
MPIFEYRCDACGHQFDVLQKLGADPLTVCPECDTAALKKLLSAPAFHLKGKGWRNSDDAPKKPDVRPKFAHTLDSPIPHAEHTDNPAPAKPDDHAHSHDKSHGHSHSHGHGHSHSHGKGHSHDH